MVAGGKQYIGSLKNIEIAFTLIPQVQNINLCFNLIEFSLIGTLTSTLEGIQSCGHSLQKLSVINCNIIELEPCFLAMLNLKEI
jgi:hypothetical protein